MTLHLTTRLMSAGCIAALVSAVSLVTTMCSAGEAPWKEVAGPVAAEVVKVRDGDTVEVEAYVWPLQMVRVAVRLRGIDAPELHGKCPGERAAAELARDRLAALVAGQSVSLTKVSGDKYFGRVLADLAMPGGEDAARLLLKERLVVPYAGHKRRDWCADASALGTAAAELPARRG